MYISIYHIRRNIPFIHSLLTYPISFITYYLLYGIYVYIHIYPLYVWVLNTFKPIIYSIYIVGTIKIIKIQSSHLCSHTCSHIHYYVFYSFIWLFFNNNLSKCFITNSNLFSKSATVIITRDPT